MTRRPAEKAGASAGGLVALVAALQGHDLVAALAAASALVPSAVTYVLTHGGVRGIARGLWSGNRRTP